MTEPNVHALTGAYILDALDPAEAVAFRAHLDTCAECRQEVATLSVTVTRLAGSVAVTPPPELLGDVMAQVERTPQAAPLVTRPTDDGQPDDEHPVTDDPPAPALITARNARRRRWPALAAAAAAVVEGDLSTVTALTVTVEPDGGSATPTGEPVATVQL